MDIGIFSISNANTQIIFKGFFSNRQLRNKYNLKVQNIKPKFQRDQNAEHFKIKDRKIAK